MILKNLKSIAVGAAGALFVVGSVAYASSNQDLAVGSSDALMKDENGIIWHASNGKLRNCYVTHESRLPRYTEYECNDWY